MSEVPIFLNNGKNAFLPVWNGFGHDLELKTERFFNGIIMSIKFDGQTFRTRDVLQISRGAWTISFPPLRWHFCELSNKSWGRQIRTH